MQSQNDQKLPESSRPALEASQLSPTICWDPQNEARTVQTLPPVELIQGHYHVIYDGAAGGQQASVTPSPQTDGN